MGATLTWVVGISSIRRPVGGPCAHLRLGILSPCHQRRRIRGGDAADAPVRRGFLGSALLFVGSLTPAYLPQNSPWWDSMRALGLDNWPAKAFGTALVIAGVALLVEAWFKLRPALYHEVKHWPITLLWSLPLLPAPTRLRGCGATPRRCIRR